MPNRLSTSPAENQKPGRIVEPATDTPTKQDSSWKNPAALALGRLGGKKGGKARAEKLSPERRKAIAAKAGKVRWDRHAAD